MNIKFGILLIIALLNFSLIYSKEGIDFKHKTLMKSLSKAGVNIEEDVEEIKLADSVIKINHLEGKYFQIQENNSKDYSFIYIGRVNSCRAGGCSATKSLIQGDSESEYFDYFILYDSSKAVKLVKVFNYQATHGFEITAKGWLKQFIGHNNTNPLLVNKNVDAISGATVSVYAITYDVEAKTRLLHSL